MINITAKPASLDIIFENHDFISINKNAGIPSQPDLTGDDSVYDKVKAYLCSRDVYVLNRIDRPVSGVIVFAKNKKVAKAFSNLINNKKISKTYYAIVENIPSILEHTLENKLIKKGNKSYIAKDKSLGKKSILKYKYIGSGDRYHYLEIKLETGRFHQIRTQLANIGCYIKGDVKYGARRANKDKSICLHAYKYEIIIDTNLNLKADFPKTALWKDLQRYIEKRL